VYVHPSAGERIPGYLCIVERVRLSSPNNYLLAWTPESLISTEDLESYVQVESNPEAEFREDGVSSEEEWFVNEDMLGSTVLIPPPEPDPPHKKYATSTPLADIYSIIVNPPTLSQWYGSMAINLVGGITLPTLWFHDDESRSTRLQKSSYSDTSEDAGEEKVVTWGGDEVIGRIGKLTTILRSSLDSNVFLVNPAVEDFTTHSLNLEGADEEGLKNERSTPSPPPASKRDSLHMDPLMAVVKEARWNILERFSKVARFSRDTAAQILEHPLARPIAPKSVTSYSEPAQSVIAEYDSARVYLAKWAASVAEESEANAIAEGKGDRRQYLGVWQGNRGPGEDGCDEETPLGVFEVLGDDPSQPPITDTRKEPVSAEQWVAWLDSEGRLKITEEQVREAVFCGGVEHDIRIEVWKFFLGLFVVTVLFAVAAVEVFRIEARIVIVVVAG